ncbi:DoxX family membrane protein [Mucilaginibacter sp. SP1R1]|uniref:DoxX family membrane protein n=1 Tax=Mucilaginibacter sp. SP1R1 TaxID=2723091 RepID=UPI001613B774|nr:DoxX family membrane protein [Mucilaginibacter sp. SP1R1]MBB6152767.1 putative membrane protein YphA (DoxX/SURF4 family) [Mucilaginibacter sp. SP1R1]
MKIAVLIARSLLGLIFLVFGLNFFFQFLHMQQPPMPEKAQAFSGGLFGAGYFFPYMKVIEIASGVALLINRYTAFFLLILFPISLNIFLFHTLLAPAGMPLGVSIIILHLFLGYAYRKYYAGIFTAVPVL